MINLLPPEDKKEIRSGRANTLLRRYIFGIFAVSLILTLLFGLYFWQLQTMKANAESAAAANEQTLATFQGTIDESKKFQNDLTIAKQILSKEVDYSGIILKIGGIMPPGTIMSAISLDPTTIGKETTINAQTRTYDDAIKLKDAMQKSGLFDDVHFLKISQSQNNSGNRYPLDVSLSVKFNQKVIK